MRCRPISVGVRQNYYTEAHGLQKPRHYLFTAIVKLRPRLRAEVLRFSLV